MIHKTAVIDPAAELGRDVTVGPFAYIERDVKIGDGCAIGPHASILRYTTLGERCRVHAGAVLGDVPQDLSFTDARSEVRIGSGCVMREGVTIHRGTKADTVTEIGENCFLMAFSHFAHNVKLGRNVIVANGALLAGYVEVGDRAFVSGNVVIHQFCRVGRIAMLGGQAAITKDVPPFCTARPSQLNSMAAPNLIGMRRAGFTPAECRDVRTAFKILYRSGLNVSQAEERLRTTFTTGPAAEFVVFIEGARRGVCGFAGEPEV